MKKIHFLLLIVLFSCSTIKKTSQDTTDRNVEVSYNQIDEAIVFNLSNISKEVVYYHKKNVLDIEKYVNESWMRVKILPCPCDAPCREINEQIPIKPNSTFEIKWNMIESWCGSYSGVELVRETISRKVDKGLYRVKFSFMYDDGKKFQEIKEFTIN